MALCVVEIEFGNPDTFAGSAAIFVEILEISSSIFGICACLLRDISFKFLESNVIFTNLSFLIVIRKTVNALCPIAHRNVSFIRVPVGRGVVAVLLSN